jgi:hypothetical protein
VGFVQHLFREGGIVSLIYQRPDSAAGNPSEARSGLRYVGVGVDIVVRIKALAGGSPWHPAVPDSVNERYRCGKAHQTISICCIGIQAALEDSPGYTQHPRIVCLCDYVWPDTQPSQSPFCCRDSKVLIVRRARVQHTWYTHLQARRQHCRCITGSNAMPWPARACISQRRKLDAECLQTAVSIRIVSICHYYSNAMMLAV